MVKKLSPLPVLFFFSALFLFSSCRRQPKACFTWNIEKPMLGDWIKINAGCSEDARSYEFFVDDVQIENDGAYSAYDCTVPGNHIIKLKAYSGPRAGHGKFTVFSQELYVAETIPVTCKSPLYIGETILLTAYFVPGATYSWQGPNSYTATGREVQIPNATAESSGIYTVTAIVNGTLTIHGTAEISVLSYPCSPVNNVCSFTGGLSTTTLNTIYPYIALGFYELHASSSSLTMYFKFKGNQVPASGIYKLEADYHSIGDGEVYMEIVPKGFFANPAGYPGQIYVFVNDGKPTITFCSVPFSYEQYIFTITGKVIQP